MYKIIRFLTLLAVVLLSTTASSQRSDYGKMSAWVRDIARQQVKNKKSGTQSEPDTRQLCALMKIKGDAQQLMADYDGTLLAQLGEVYVVSIPIYRLDEINADERTMRIEARQSNRLMMDTTLYIVGADHVYNGLHLPQAFTGKGVVVGVQDVGFDLTHPNFYSRDLKDYRIKRFWDQLATDNSGEEMYVGKAFEGKENLLRYAHSRDAQLTSHGTHTSGTAAGSGYNTDYRGIAFESDICLVSNAVTTNAHLIDSTDIYKHTYATDVLGFKYISDYADAVGKPCVISFSEGSHQDIRGDDALLYEALAALSKPGHIIVAAAGNEGHLTTYVEKPANKTEAGTYIWSNGKRAAVTIDASGKTTIRAIVYHNLQQPDTITITTDEVFAAEGASVSDSIVTEKGTFRMAIDGFQSCYDSSRLAFDVILTAPERLGQDIPIWIETKGEESDTRMFLLSGYFYNQQLNHRTGEAVSRYNIHSPASAPDVVCVGAMGYRRGFTTVSGNYQEPMPISPGLRAYFSSVGPTIDNRIKPDVMAPGTHIVSSYSSYFLESNPEWAINGSDISHFGFNGRTYSWTSDAGTSMSTPIVAGIIALWLEACPTLTREEVIETFKKTCPQPEPALAYPNNEYGHGLINAYAGLLYILGLDLALGTDELSRHQPQNASISLKGRTLEINLTENNTKTNKTAEVRVYNTKGQLLKTASIDSYYQTIDLSLLPNGIYAIQLQTDDYRSTGSTLIRLQ